MNESVQIKLTLNNNIFSYLNGYLGHKYWYFAVRMYNNPEHPYDTEGFPPATDPGTDIAVLWVKDQKYHPLVFHITKRRIILTDISVYVFLFTIFK